MVNQDPQQGKEPVTYSGNEGTQSLCIQESPKSAEEKHCRLCD